MEIVYATNKEVNICNKLKSEAEQSFYTQEFLGESVVFKPWGYEYMHYEAEDKSSGSWFLHIKPNDGTSLHCHSHKTTVFHIVSGSIEMQFLDKPSKILKEGDTITLKAKVFHATVAREEGACLIEIESPSDKNDAIRYKDLRGRVGKRYDNKCSVMKYK
jgi:mannose-6-phosphate isomerase-like protein (cupin superfamily)